MAVEDYEDTVVEPSIPSESGQDGHDVGSSDEIANRPHVKAAFEKIERELSGPSEAPPSNGKPMNGKATARRAQQARARRESEETAQVEGISKKSSRQTFQEASDDQTAAPEGGVSPTAEDGSEAPVDQTAETTLPPVLRSAAQRAGMSNEEIDEFYQANPEYAARTFQKFLHSFNEISTQFARLGQARLQGGQQPQQQQYQQQPQQRQGRQQPQQQQQSGGDPLDELFSEASLAELSQSEGEVIVDRVLRPLQQHLVGPVRQMQEHLNRMLQREQRMHEEGIRREVVSTFSELEKDYGDVFGTMKKGLSGEQQQLRRQVLQVADAIYEGHRAQGLELTVADAMGRAKDLVLAPKQAEIERTKLRQQVQKRQGGFTARPTQRRVAQTTGDGAEKSYAAAEEAYARRAAELGMSLE